MKKRPGDHGRLRENGERTWWWSPTMTTKRERPIDRGQRIAAPRVFPCGDFWLSPAMKKRSGDRVRMSSRAPRAFPLGDVELAAGQGSGPRDRGRGEDGRRALHVVAQGKESVAAGHAEGGTAAAVSQMKKAAELLDDDAQY